MEITFSLLPLDEESIIEYEKMRLEAYGIQGAILTLQEIIHNTFTTENNLLAVGLFFDNELDAVCYVSNRYHSLFIENLFVRKSKQGTGLHLGQALLQYVLDNKTIFEQYFGEELTTSILDAVDEKSKNIYKSFGYRENGGFCHLKKDL